MLVLVNTTGAPIFSGSAQWLSQGRRMGNPKCRLQLKPYVGLFSATANPSGTLLSRSSLRTGSGKSQSSTSMTKTLGSGGRLSGVTCTVARLRMLDGNQQPSRLTINTCKPLLSFARKTLQGAGRFTRSASSGFRRSTRLTRRTTLSLRSARGLKKPRKLVSYFCFCHCCLKDVSSCAQTVFASSSCL